MNKYVLDTHTLIWYLEGNSKLGKKAKTIFFYSSIGTHYVQHSQHQPRHVFTH